MLMPETSASITTILVIDSDADLVTAYCHLLSLNGFAVLNAATGQEGIQLVKLHQPQLTVCEVGLPDMSGYDVLTHLRSHPTNTPPIIILTGHGVSTEFRHSMEAGADDYLPKPVNLQSFLRAVQTQVDKREQLAKCLRAESVELTDDPLASAISWRELENQIKTIKQLPWSSLWVIQIRDHNALQTGYGHVFGQLVLQSIGQRLQKWQQQWNEPTISAEFVAYLGENRFVVFLSALQTPVENICVTAIANLKTDLQQYLVINNHRLIPDISIEAIGDLELTTVKTLKKLNRLTAPTVNQLSLSEQLRRAIQQDELQLYFQPQVDLSSGHIIGAEALLRWILPGEPPILPVQLISIAEENGLMLPLGEWILKTALRQLAYWQKVQLSGVSIALNLSVYQLRSLHFIDRLMAMVESAKVNPVMIDLELPERLIIEDLNRAQLLLTELQHRGFSTAIDDFGSGCLNHLPHLPVNILKLDKCFVRELHQNKSNQVIVGAIIEMAQGLNISTIANGVETAKELSILKQLKCHSMQGYLFSPALAAKDFEKLLLEPSREQLKQPENHVEIS